MRILVTSPGHIRTAPMGHYCAETLRAMGHTTRLFDAGSLQPIEKLLFRPLAKLRGDHRFEKRRLNQRLLQAVEDFHPDLLLSIFGFDIFPETIQAIRQKGVRTACWWLNDPFQLERAMTIAPPYDHFFTNSDVTVPAYTARGIRSAHYLPHAAFTSIHRPISLGENEGKEWGSEVCFVGDWGPVRQGILSMLSQKVDLRIWGPWRKHLTPRDRLWSRIVDGYFTPEEMVKAFCSAKIVINLHSWFGYYEHGLNPRVFETPACRALQICDWKQELEYHFRDENEIVTYRTGSELESKILDLLKNSGDREKIARAGFARSEKEHTYPVRMSQLLGKIG